MTHQHHKYNFNLNLIIQKAVKIYNTSTRNLSRKSIASVYWTLSNMLSKNTYNVITFHSLKSITFIIHECLISPIWIADFSCLILDRTNCPNAFYFGIDFDFSWQWQSEDSSPLMPFNETMPLMSQDNFNFLSFP